MDDGYGVCEIMLYCYNLYNDLYLLWAVFVSKSPVLGPSKLLKQIIQILRNIVKNPNWPETN